MLSPVKLSLSGFKSDFLAGTTVALALVPEAVAFAFVAGLDPMIGLYGAFMMGLVTSIIGGRPGMISGATGALAVVMVHLVREGNALMPQVEGAGVQYLFATLVLMGLIQVSAGALKLGKFVRLIPHPVMLGFVNGLAIVIFMSQLQMFKVQGEWLSGSPLWVFSGLIALTMGIIVLLPRVTSTIPPGLAAIVSVSLLSYFAGLDTSTVLSYVQSSGGQGIQGQLPHFAIPQVPLTLESLFFIAPYALILAAIGLIESLMTLTLIDEITETRGSSNKECVAQGVANLTNAFFGGMGGCAMIGQSIINIKSGGRSHFSGLVAALLLLSFILFLSPLIEQVPIAALVGVMFMVVIGTFSWSSLPIIHKIPRTDAFVLILVSGLTVVFDLAVAVICGVIISSLVFAWENAKRIRARKSTKEDGTKVYEIWGPLFFGSSQMFQSKFTPSEDPQKVEIDFADCKVSDHSGIESIRFITEKYEKLGKEVQLRHLSSDCQRILLNAEKKLDKLIIRDSDDPHYFVVQ